MARHNLQIHCQPSAWLATRRAAGALASLLFLTAGAIACSVPVYRYALERWQADPFEALVYYRGSLPESAARTIAEAKRSTSANLKFRSIDLDAETDPDIIELWEDEEADTLPWLVLTYPNAYPYLGPVASGNVSEDFISSFSTSSMRDRIADRITSGETAVWILLESGDEAEDNAIANMLEQRLGHLEEALELPTLEQEDIDAGLVSISQDELKVDFSVMRLSRDDPAEETLVEMLLDSEEDLTDQDGPLVFPVFGRGRTLYALVDEGINAGTIDQAAEYIVGACSCQVKEQNPGVDLLIAMDWDAAIGTSHIVERELPPLEGAGILAASSSETPGAPDEVSPPGPPVQGAAEESTMGSSQWRNIASIVTLVLLVLIAGSLFILTRNSRSQ